MQAKLLFPFPILFIKQHNNQNRTADKDRQDRSRAGRIGHYHRVGAGISSTSSVYIYFVCVHRVRYSRDKILIVEHVVGVQ